MIDLVSGHNWSIRETQPAKARKMSKRWRESEHRIYLDRGNNLNEGNPMLPI